MPGRPPAASLETWLRTPRHAEAPGIYAYGHTPRPPEDPDRIPDRKLIGGAVLALLCGLLVWSLAWDGYLPFWLWPLGLVDPGFLAEHAPVRHRLVHLLPALREL